MGPQAVDAGECDRCGRAPRFAPGCGPAGPGAVCVPCARDLDLDLWCDGHAEAGRSALAAIADLPPEWDLVTRLWWVATGEVRLDTLVVPPTARLPTDVRAALGR